MGDTLGVAMPASARTDGEQAGSRSGDDAAGIKQAVDEYLYAFLARQAAEAVSGRMPPIIIRTLGGFLRAGGKRLRPTFCVLGHLAAGGEMDGGLVGAAASLELFHAYALIHDDVMDGSATRRGQPTVHRALAAHYHGLAARRGERLRGARADRFGVAGAILLGDIALTWSDEMLNGCGLSPSGLAAARQVIDAMRIEVMYGQWLDVHTLGRPHSDLAAPLAVARYKSAKYTCERPLHLGAVLAGAGPEVLTALSRFALPIGEAFQLRDDLLGVFGDPAVTGKPAVDDLREGKRTVLLAVAHARATPAQRRVLRDHVGDPRLDAAGLRRVRQLLVEVGAVQEVERLIAERREQACAALDDPLLAPRATPALRRLVHVLAGG